MAGSIEQLLLYPANLLGLCWIGAGASAALLLGFGARWAAGVIAVAIAGQARVLGVYGNLPADLLLLESALVLWMIGPEGAGERWSLWKRILFALFAARVFWSVWPDALAAMTPYYWMSFAAVVLAGRWVRRVHLIILSGLSLSAAAGGGDWALCAGRIAVIAYGWESGQKLKFKESDPLGFARHGLLAQGWVALKVVSLIVMAGYLMIAADWIGRNFTPAPQVIFPSAMTEAVRRFVPSGFDAGYPGLSRPLNWRIQIEVSADGQAWSPLSGRVWSFASTQITDRLGAYLEGMTRLGPSETMVLSRLGVRYFATDSPVRTLFEDPGFKPAYFRYAVYQKDPKTGNQERFVGTALFPIQWNPSTGRADWVIAPR